MKRKQLHLALVGAGLMNAGLAPAVFAHDGDLSTLVVSATRTEIDIKNAPASVSVITDEDLRQMTVFTVDEALKNTVGVMNRRTKGFMETTPSLTIRGFSNARDNLVLVDGIPQNDSRNGQVNWTMIDGENVERIEVLRGPFSSLYGGNAMGGVVSIFTKMPERSGATLKIGTGGSLDSVASDDFRDLSFTGTLKATDTLALGMSYRQRSTAGYPTTHVNVATVPDGVTGAVPYASNVGANTNLIGDTGDNWYEDDTVGFRLSFAPSATTRLDVSHVDSRADYGYDFPNTLLRTSVEHPTLGTVDDIATFSTVALTSWLNGAVFARGGRMDQTNTGLSFRTEWKDLAAKVSLGHIEKYTETVIVGGITLANSGHAAMSPVTFSGGDGRLAPANDNTRTSADVQFDWSIHDRHLLTFGLAASRGEIDEERWSLSNWNDPGSKVFMGSKTTAEDEMRSLYLQDAWFINDSLTAYIGARQDWWEMKGGQTRSFTADGGSGTLRYDGTDTSSFSPKLSLVFRPTQATTYRASIGKAFRPPTLFEFFGTAQVGGDAFAGNPDLKPETVTSWELGIDHDFSSGINLVGTYFQSEIDDMIQTVAVGGISTPQNTSEAEIKGVELEIRGPLPYGLSWSANYTYTDTEVTRHDTTPDLVGNRLTHVPKTMYNLSLDWQWQDWQVTATNYYQSKRFTNAANTDVNTGVPGSTDSFDLTDLKATYRFSDRHSASLGINNVFDKEYRQFYLSPGRFWFVEVRAQY
jgi:iron complex outermembrane receptor protein